jgi:uncharacterized protein (TIGR04141 family)
MAKEQEISIYKIDLSNVFFNGCNNNFDEIITRIITRGDQNNVKKVSLERDERSIDKYESLMIRDEIDVYGLNVQLYHSRRKIPNTWTSFLSDASSEAKRYWNENHDFITFIYDDKHLFCFTGGIAFHLVEDVYDEEFSRELMIRLANPEKIKLAKSRALTGALYAKEFYFRGDYTISASEAFGSVWKEIKMSLKDEIITDQDWKDILGETFLNLTCDAGSSFQIKRRVSFQTAIRMIKKIKEVYETNPTEEERILFSFLNSVKPVRDKELINSLSKQLIEKAFLYLKSRKNNSFDYDFCHKNYEKFNSASEFIVKKGKTQLWSWKHIDNAAQILDIGGGWFNLNDLDEFSEDFTERIRIIAKGGKKEEDNTEGSIYEHLHGELVDKNTDKIYFFIDKRWYFVDDNFLETLETDFSRYVDSNPFCNIPLEKWPDKNMTFKNNQVEGFFNQSHLCKANFLVGDRITMKGLELFDLLYKDNDDLYIIQVKDGFGASTRDACSQLRNSAKIIEESIKTINYSKLKNYYSELEARGLAGDLNDKYKEQLFAVGSDKDFIDLFKGEKIKRHYVLAFHYNANSGDIKKTKSSIAKFEILGLRDNLKSLSIADLKLFRIPG